MSSQSVDINNTKTMVLTNTSKYNSFIYDVELDISYTADSAWKTIRHLQWTILATITGQIGYKYKNWEKCSYMIAHRLCNKLGQLTLSATECKGQISDRGQYHDEDADSNYSEIIHDCFCYDGLMTIPKYSDPISKSESPPVCLQYTIRFLLSPALPSAQSIYCANGYKMYGCRTIINREKKCRHINIEVDHEKEYNHLEVWQAAYKAYEL
ncbi:hypothetical protein PV328_007934 [Microctonus aethiopoides]|uniref:Uncharacterized protein n=1 Tax=Microctonus aethiopoides TaxID=144406 RepID=A0AA39EZB9_9HYME|nr:hypothetical protein PV328_007934 [Microctonus aethiopoides]